MSARLYPVIFNDESTDLWHKLFCKLTRYFIIFSDLKKNNYFKKNLIFCIKMEDLVFLNPVFCTIFPFLINTFVT